MQLSFIDTHCHLDLLSDCKQQIDKARKKGVTKIVVPAVDPNNFSIVKTIASENTGIFYSVGIHPCVTQNISIEDIIYLENFLIKNINDPKLVAVGEIGLDFFLKNLNRSKMEKIYISQLNLAKKFSLPVLLHVRKAQDLILKYFKTSGVSSGIAHAFNGSSEQADKFINSGLVLGFGGAMTYERALQIRRIACNVPLDSFVFETDSPDLLPCWSKNGIQNSPSEIPMIATCFASIRGESIHKIAYQSNKNACRVLPKLPKNA